MDRDTTDPTAEERWRPRPLLSFALRLVSVLIPAAAGAATAYAFGRSVPMPEGLARIPWVLAIVLCATVATATAERVGKRFLPLAMLFRLSLVFPDRAPSRFAMARGAGNVRVLERRIGEAREGGIDPEPSRAAEQILSLVAALSAHDRKTRGHSERVRAFTDLLATQLRIPQEDRDRLRWAALLHDVGKLRVPARILNKPGRPEPHEWETLQRHPEAGAGIAEPLLAWLGPWGDAIAQHHERYDGGGYPRALAADEISFAARVVCVADSFEVMTAARSYKKPMSVPAARRELAACAGTQFDPAIVRAFLNVSLGRLWWAVGPTSWTALVPVLGSAQRAGGQLAAAAKGTAAAVAVGITGLLPVLGGTAATAGPAGPARAAGAVSVPDSSPAPVGGADVGPGGRGRGGTDVEIVRSDPGGTSGEEPVDPTDPIDPTPPDPVDDLVTDPVRSLDRTVDDATGAVEDVLGGATEAVDGLTDTATDVVGGAGGTLTETVDDTVSGATGSLGGLLGG